MNDHRDDCQRCRDWNLEVLDGASPENCPEKVIRHLAECSACRTEQAELEQTLELLGSLKEVETPRHFFVYKERAENVGWTGWWKIFLSARAVATVSSLSLLLVVGLLASGLQVRTDGASLTLGLGTLPVLAQPRVEADPELLRADFRRILTEELSARDRKVLEQIKAKMSSFDDMEAARSRQLERVMASLDSRLEDSLQERDQVFSESLRLAAMEIYRTLSAEQQRSILNLNARLERMEETDHIQGTQTEALMATVMQLAQRYE